MQSFTNTMLNSVVAGALVPAVSRTLAGLTVAAVSFSAAGWVTWAYHHRVAHPRVVAPPDPESYEPTDQL